MSQLQERSSGHARYAFNAQNTYGEYLGVEFPKYQEDTNIVNNNSAPQQQRQGWNQ
jgi:hypothetical protein